MGDVRTLAAKLAALKYLADAVAAETTTTKAAIGALMDEGDRKTAAVDFDGAAVEVGTVSKSKGTEAEDLVIRDESAVINWLKTKGTIDGIHTVEALADWKAGEVLAHVKATGEEVPGVEWVTKRRASYVSVRLTDAHLESIRGLIASGGITLRELTAGGE